MFRHSSVQHEAGTYLYQTPTAKIVALSKKKLNMLCVLLVQKPFWQIKGQEKQPPGTCGEAPPLKPPQGPHSHPTSPISGNIVRHKLTRTYNSVTAPISTNSSFFTFFFFLDFLLLVYFTDSRCRELLTPHTHSLYIHKSIYTSIYIVYTSLILKAYFYQSSQRQKKTQQVSSFMKDVISLQHTPTFSTTSLFQF